jgi:hypothetical protein
MCVETGAMNLPSSYYAGHTFMLISIPLVKNESSLWIAVPILIFGGFMLYDLSPWVAASYSPGPHFLSRLIDSSRFLSSINYPKVSTKGAWWSPSTRMWEGEPINGALFLFTSNVDFKV